MLRLFSSYVEVCSTEFPPVHKHCGSAEILGYAFPASEQAFGRLCAFSVVAIFAVCARGVCCCTITDGEELPAPSTTEVLPQNVCFAWRPLGTRLLLPWLPWCSRLSCLSSQKINPARNHGAYANHWCSSLPMTLRGLKYNLSSYLHTQNVLYHIC